MRMNLTSAVQDFRRARRQAALEEILNRLTGEPAELLSYEDVRRKLNARQRGGEKLEDIPLGAIVGSVGRYRDFTRSFLPKDEIDEGRWARVEVAMTDMTGVPPIKVYRVGDAYFVRDGHHRVSVARQLGASHIEAYVTDVETKVPLSSDVDPGELILKAEYAEFLAQTQIDEARPDADLTVTAPGKYHALEKHIEVHRHFMGLEQQREIPYREAVVHWYDEVYLPVVTLIRQRAILRDFPERTETDLYLWLAEHRAALEEELEWEVSPEMAAVDLADQFSSRPERVVSRVGKKLLAAVTPDELEAGPPPGKWREERLTARGEDRLFADILVAVDGGEGGWSALDQALILARRGGARLQGLHVVPSEADEESEEARAVQAEFDRRCQEAGVPGHLALDAGSVRRRVCERARWTDLVILSLNYPPGPRPMSKLSSGLVAILRRCPRPVLTVPEAPSHLRCALLAYDGSPKAEEALFIATYVAGRWDVPLVVLTVTEGEPATPETVAHARAYLEGHDVHAEFVAGEGPVAESILTTAQDRGCDLILMGGYGQTPVVEVVLGSTVHQILRKGQWPTLICR